MASLVSSVSRSIRSYGSLEIVVEVRCVLTIMICYITPLSIHHTERRGRNHLRKPCNRRSTCQIRVHTLTPKHVSIVARSGVAVERSSQTYWRPRSPHLTKDSEDDRETTLSCLRLSRRRVRVTPQRRSQDFRNVLLCCITSQLEASQHNKR